MSFVLTTLQQPCWLPSLVWGPLSAPSSRCMFPSFSWRTLIVRVGSVGDGHEFLSVLTVPIYIPLPFLIACSADFTPQHWMKATGIRRLLNPLSQVHTLLLIKYTCPGTNPHGCARKGRWAAISSSGLMATTSGGPLARRKCGLLPAAVSGPAEGGSQGGDRAGIGRGWRQRQPGRPRRSSSRRRC